MCVIVCVLLPGGWGGGLLMLHSAEWRCWLGEGEAGDDLVSVCLMKESQIIPTLSTWALRWPRACVRGKVSFAAAR